MYYLGVTLAIISCLACGTMEVLVSACHSVSTSVLVSWSAITGESLFSSQIPHSSSLGFIIAVIYCLLSGTSQLLSRNIVSTTWSQWLTFTGLSLSGLVAFTTLTMSLQLVSPNLVASLRCLELVLAFTVQTLLTGHLPDIISITGSLLITLGVILLATQEKLERVKLIILKFIKKTSRPRDEDDEASVLITK